eukprot:Hpha_TRINITY_DN12699_c0_g2::TRINITY_DN12699_c0_g2_i1::g.49459::m.49459
MGKAGTFGPSAARGSVAASSPLGTCTTSVKVCASAGCFGTWSSVATGSVTEVGTPARSSPVCSSVRPLIHRPEACDAAAGVSTVGTSAACGWPCGISTAPSLRKVGASAGYCADCSSGAAVCSSVIVSSPEDSWRTVAGVNPGCCTGVSPAPLSSPSRPEAAEGSTARGSFAWSHCCSAGCGCATGCGCSTDCGCSIGCRCSAGCGCSTGRGYFRGCGSSIGCGGCGCSIDCGYSAGCRCSTGCGYFRGCGSSIGCGGCGCSIDCGYPAGCGSSIGCGCSIDCGCSAGCGCSTGCGYFRGCGSSIGCGGCGCSIDCGYSAGCRCSTGCGYFRGCG